MTEDNTKNLAEKIAGLLESESSRPDLASIAANLEKINQRLDRLEGMQAVQSVTQNAVRPHPSLDKFDIPEAIADFVFSKMGKEKACTFEPNKPCDHCSMCNSRGF